MPSPTQTPPARTGLLKVLLFRPAGALREAPPLQPGRPRAGARLSQPQRLPRLPARATYSGASRELAHFSRLIGARFRARSVPRIIASLSFTLALFAVAPGSLAASDITRLVPDTTEAGVSVAVTNRVAPGEEVLVYVVEENVPFGWAVSRINERGTVDAETGKIKWGPFFDGRPRELTYRLTPPENFRGVTALSGQGSFNGERVVIGGITQIRVVLPQGRNAENTILSSLPKQYLPGSVVVLTNQVRLAEETLVYLVEDAVPDGWSVGAINHGGQFDPVRKKIKWGPFSDRVERELRCEFTTPRGVTNAVRFAGIGSFDGVELRIAGDRETAPIVSAIVSELPAQFQPGESVTVKLSVAPAPNTTVFALQEAVPNGWTVQQVSHEGVVDPMHRTIKWGPFFSQDALALTYRIKAPENLVTNAFALAGVGSFDGAPIVTTGQRVLAASSSRVTRLMPPEFLATASFAVTHRTVPDSVIRVYVIEDKVPFGWAIGDISDNGAFDPVTSKVKWGPFLDATPRDLHYTVTPPPSARLGIFEGAGSFDGRSIGIAGQQQTRPASAESLHRAVRSMPATVRAGRSIVITNRVVTGPGLVVWSFEEALPAGWKASDVNEGGEFDAATSKVKWGPFLDGNSRVLVYRLVPALDAGGPVVIEGVGSFNGEPVRATGATNLLAIANHAPLARDDLFQRSTPGTFTLRAGDLLANDNDPDGDPLRLAEIDAASELGGSVTLADGIITYAPPAGAARADSFSYFVEDGFGGRTKGRVEMAIVPDGPSLNRVSLEFLPNGIVRLRFVGIPGRRYRIQASDSLETPQWIDVATAVASVHGDFEFDDTDAANHRTRFYRTVSP